MRLTNSRHSAGGRNRPVRFILSRLLWASRLCKLFVIERENFKLRFFPTALSASYWVNNKERDEDERFISKYLRSGDVMIDVGANIGALSLAGAAVVGESGRVFAIEAHPRTFRYLDKNIKLNQFKNIKLINSAIGASPGVVSFADIRSDDQNAIAEDGELRVNVDTLDNLFSSQVADVALMKVDVEGFEKHVFEGAKHILLKTKAVYFEAWETHFNKYNYSTSDVLQMLRSLGFGLFRLVGNDLLEIASDYSADRCQNLLAIRNIQHFKGRLGIE